MLPDCDLCKSRTNAKRILEKTLGLPPEGKEMCHICDEPKCKNPSHIFFGTHSENMKDCAAIGRLPIAGWNRGIKHSKETKKKISESVTNRNATEEYKTNMSIAIRKSSERPRIKYVNGVGIPL